MSRVRKKQPPRRKLRFSKKGNFKINTEPSSSNANKNESSQESPTVNSKTRKDARVNSSVASHTRIRGVKDKKRSKVHSLSSCESFMSGSHIEPRAKVRRTKRIKYRKQSVPRPPCVASSSSSDSYDSELPERPKQDPSSSKPEKSEAKGPVSCSTHSIPLQNHET